jgi:tetratricopeptide (TPR) repeat protein
MPSGNKSLRRYCRTANSSICLIPQQTQPYFHPRDLGEARKAIELYEQALPILRQLGDRRGEGNALLNKALALHELGDRQQATACMWQALSIFVAIESPHAPLAKQLLDQWSQPE